MIKELLIYKNEQLHCIVPEDRAKQALDALKKCYPEDEWTLRDKPIGAMRSYRLRLIDKILWAVIGFIVGVVLTQLIIFIELL